MGTVISLYFRNIYVHNVVTALSKALTVLLNENGILYRKWKPRYVLMALIEEIIQAERPYGGARKKKSSPIDETSCR